MWAIGGSAPATNFQAMNLTQSNFVTHSDKCNRRGGSQALKSYPFLCLILLKILWNFSNVVTQKQMSCNERAYMKANILAAFISLFFARSLLNRVPLTLMLHYYREEITITSFLFPTERKIYSDFGITEKIRNLSHNNTLSKFW